MRSEGNTMLGLLRRRALWPSGALVLIWIVFTLQRSHSGPESSAAHFRSLDTSDCLGHVFNSTLGFEDILVVGMPSRTDRRDGRHPNKQSLIKQY
ncbi:hypothetical protein H633G_11390 [Metarhizium anisopliae BRIP 53284]|nr:hypothetical protein H633G_11390 [Metarhizium anisopliae BRIP 53284]